ncbi:hypothetical protein FIB18_22865 [Brucella pecoris]|uniref:Uncharacterized protein n=1 Tax=Brucella pecoris TaxID=867683 RepID=A0A5C5CCT3_9HYPH|nr:hypothetical protein FIB18_22865 [Brucella pecoris]
MRKINDLLILLNVSRLGILTLFFISPTVHKTVTQSYDTCRFALVGLSRGSKRRVHYGSQTSGSESSTARKYLGRNIGSRHLAFSLKQSDHRQAGHMARKLNLLLYEIAENPRSVLMSKEALEGLFQSEIARMNDHMENPQFAGQRTPTGFHQIDNLTADLEVGWAYRLLENSAPAVSCSKRKVARGGAFLSRRRCQRASAKTSRHLIVVNAKTQKVRASSTKCAPSCKSTACLIRSLISKRPRLNISKRMRTFCSIPMIAISSIILTSRLNQTLPGQHQLFRL